MPGALTRSALYAVTLVIFAVGAVPGSISTGSPIGSRTGQATGGPFNSRADHVNYQMV